MASISDISYLPECPIRLRPRWAVGEHYEVDVGKPWQYMVTDKRTGVEYSVPRTKGSCRNSLIEYEAINRKTGFKQGCTNSCRTLNPEGPRHRQIADIVDAVISYEENNT